MSQVQAGDEILAFDAATGRNVPGQVVETFTHEDVAVLELETSAGKVETTATHPFYVEGKGYTPAQDLRAGDLLRTPTGQRV
ncbi:polymorphic toxin-type HINT domain-containing protein, partial [Schaalia canis]|uniref:polymorphic toxin-type HINT domain-containing protein n=1 Tax=Schaalia canis TaxID=100469 RepID=UPI003B837DDB